MTAKTPTFEECNKMAIAFIESACYKNDELDRGLVSLIRKGCATFVAPDQFQITELGMNEVENGQT
jgi:hypothetical protein